MPELRVIVEEVRGRCAAGYKPGDEFLLRDFYVERMQDVRICLHALSSMLTLISPLLKGVPPASLGIGSDETAHVQCPDPGPPYRKHARKLYCFSGEMNGVDRFFSLNNQQPVVDIDGLSTE